MALKLGAEDKKKVYIAGGLGVVVLGLIFYNLKDSFSGSAPAPAAVVAQAPTRPASSSAPGSSTPTSSTPSSSAKAHEATKLASATVNLDPTLHPELMAQAESLEYTGNGRNIFSLTSVPVEIPKPIVSPRNVQQANIPTGPPPPAPPPAIDLKFFGFSARQSGARRAFLLKGDDVFIAAEGDVVDHRYKVVKIAPTSIQVEDIPYANTQSLPLLAN
jgi:hypothetical protein